MSFRNVAIANGVTSILTGVLALLAPGVLASLYQVTATERESALIQMLGAAYVGLGLVTWLVRDSADALTHRGVAAASLAAWLVSLAVSFIWMRLAGPAVWGNVVLQAAFALAWLYVLMQARSRSA